MKSDLVGQLFRDIRMGIRSLRASSGASWSSVITLALVLAVNVIIFSLLSSAGFRNLPFPDQAHLFYLWGQGANTSLAHQLAGHELFINAGAIEIRSGIISEPVTAERISGLRISENLLSTLRVNPVRGRFFAAGEYLREAPVVLVSSALWRRLFPDVDWLENQTIRVDGESLTVVGIVPVGLESAIRPGVFHLFYPAQIGHGENAGIIARSIPAAGLRNVRHYLSTIALSSEQQESGPATLAETIRFESIPRLIFGDTRQYLIILQVCAIAALLIGCSNVTSIMLTRTIHRRREFAIRSALGADRGILTRQILLESSLVGCSGAVLGLGLAILVTAWLKRILPLFMLQHAGTIRIGSETLLFGVLATILTSILISSASIFVTTRNLEFSALRSDRTTTGGGRKLSRFRSSIVAFEIALALGLVTASGIVTETFLRLQPDDPGFNPRDKLSFRISLPSDRYPSRGAQSMFLDDMKSALASLPGVNQVAYVNSLPMSGEYWVEPGRIEGSTSHDSRPVYVFAASEELHDVLQIRQLRGSSLASLNAGTSDVLINETMAATLWSGIDPIGEFLILGEGESEVRYRVAGVVGDTRISIAIENSRPSMWVRFGAIPDQQATFVIGVDEVSTTLLQGIRNLVSGFDSSLSVERLETLEELLADSVRYPAFAMKAVSASGFLALVLAIIGLFGLISFAIGRRTREFGIRLALGAHRRDIVQLMLISYSRIVAIGTGFGLVFAIWLHALLRSGLVGIRSQSLWMIVPAVIVIAFFALIACWLPAHRAGGMDPAEILKYE